MCRLKRLTPRPVPSNEWRPFGSLRREIDRLFDDVDHGFLGLPFRRSLNEWGPSWLGEMVPAVDIAEKDKAYEITAELPGLDQGREEAGNRGEEGELLYVR